MNLFLYKLRTLNRAAAAAVSLAIMLSASLPTGALAQEGIVARQQSQQTPKPPETPPGQKKEVPKPDIQKLKEQQEEQGETRPGRETEREKRNIPAPTEAPSAPAQQPQAAQNPITEPLALSPEISRQRVGVSEDQKETLTLQDAITLALQNNLDIEVFRQSVQAAQYNLFAAHGVYDIVSGSEISYQSRTFPVASIFAGGGASSAITQKVLVYNFTTSQAVQPTGGLWEVDFNNSRTNTSATSATLTTQYNPTLSFTYSQPLLRNFSIDNNRRQIQLLKRSLDLSDSEFRQRVIDIINSVQQAYWDLVFAIRNEQIARDAVELTRVQLDNNRKMVEAGTLAPIELRSTEAALESRKEQVIIALQSITTAENTLKGLLIKDPGDKLWNAEIVPTNEPQFGQPQVDLNEATRLALANRPELEQMRLQAEQKNIDIDFFKNQTKPQVDLFGVYSNTGLAGTPSTIGGGVGASVPERFRGGYFQSLNNLFSQDFRTWEGGVRFSFPWRNRTAEGNLGRALAESRQIDALQRQLVQNVQIEVRNAVQAVEAARQRFEAARANRIAADAQYKGELERFRAGLSTNFFVLQRQTDLASARGNEVRALTDYNKALASLQRVTGMTLTNNNVQVTALPPESKK